MKKRITALILATLTVLSLMAIPASAKTYFVDDASEYRLDGADSNAQWSMSKGTSPLTVCTVEDGIIKMESPEGVTSGNGINLTAKYTDAPMERTISFDFMTDGIGDSVVANYWTPVYQVDGTEVIGRIQMYFYDHRLYMGGQGENLNTTVVVPLTRGTWYSVAFKTVMIDGKATVLLYHKEKDADTYTLHSTRLYPNRTASPGADTNTMRFMAATSAATAAKPRLSEANFYIDNFRVYDGTNLESGSFSIGGEEVKKIADITGGGALTASAVITDHKTETDAEKSIRTILVAYGEDGMMHDCSVNSDAKIKGGVSELTASIDISEYYDELKYAGLFVWDGMQPMSKAIEIK